MNKKLLTVLLIVITYLATTGISYSLFAGKQADDFSSVTPVDEKSTSQNDYEALVFDQNQKKTEECPISGAMYSKQQRAWWEKHRPLGVMIENTTDARPQSGLSFADTVYEAVAEGGITRFLTIFYCQDAGIIGPVRSARTYFVDFISEYGEFPLYGHVGGANTDGPADAIGQIEQYGWKAYNDLDQFGVPFPVYKQIKNRNNRDVATEHTMYSNTSSLWNYAAKKRDITDKDKDGNSWDEAFTPYSFKEDAKETERPAVQTAHIEFWEGQGDFAVDWAYDKATNTYLRKVGGKAHMDRNTNKQLAAKNVVVLFMQENRANDGYQNNLHLVYKNKGTGKAIILQDGKQIKGTWRKDKRTSKTKILAADGSELTFNRGLIWFQILPLDGVAQIK